MTAPDMASLERSLQECSLNHHHSSAGDGGGGISPENHHHRSSSSDATLELNSNRSLPYHWEQCLDLKTGEVYYINWRTGMKVKEDPRTADNGFSGYFYSDDDDEEEDENDDSSYYSEGSSSESSPAATSSRQQKEYDENEEESSGGGGHVLVVAGCKSCFMYFMVPKPVEDCPKCTGQLLHFDRSDDP